ncbi:hypothetical protein FVE85_0708 [Porphyridium purpureum]|uniref:Uncharacterized protein n=1 Tax=Porphyridium purpureum TaxID=35688 RepID=A0A5J4YZB7_PORPP|nr:hypothetical protein FVE85_0708 [Porphyridium purpureum]|eukprot:POR6205..scf208_2
MRSTYGVTDWIKRRTPAIVARDASSSNASMSGKSQEQRVLRELRERRIRGVAFDWDLTAYCFHSGGRLRGSRQEQDERLTHGMSSDFRALFNALLTARASCASVRDQDKALKLGQGADAAAQLPEFKLAILTHSDPQHASWAKADPQTGDPALGGESMVRRGLQLNFGETNGADLDAVVVVALYPSLYQKKEEYESIGLTQPPPPGKQFHLQTFRAAHGLEPGEIVLIDDDMTNVEQARRLGYHAVLVRGQGFVFEDFFDAFFML